MANRSDRGKIVLCGIAALLVAYSAPAYAQKGKPGGSPPNPGVRYMYLQIGTLGGPASWAHAINNRGEIVGSSATADGAGAGFVCTTASPAPINLNDVTDLPTGWRVGGAYDINDA